MGRWDPGVLGIVRLDRSKWAVEIVGIRTAAEPPDIGEYYLLTGGGLIGVMRSSFASIIISVIRTIY